MFFASVSIPDVGFSLLSFVRLMIQRLGWTVSLLIGATIVFAVIRSALSFFRSSENDHRKKDYYEYRRRFYYRGRFHRRYSRSAVRYRRRYYYYRRRSR